MERLTGGDLKGSVLLGSEVRLIHRHEPHRDQAAFSQLIIHGVPN